MTDPTLAAQIEAIARIIDPDKWYYRDAYINIMRDGGGCAKVTYMAIANDRVSASVAKAQKIEAIVTALRQAEQREPKWAGEITVGDMIANLQTMPPEMPLYSAYHVQMSDGQMRTFVRHPTCSRERVDGREIKTGDESVPYSAVMWTQPKEPHVPETLRQAEAAPGVVEALIDLRDKANSVLTAMDKYNSDNDTHLGGAPFFGLGHAIAKADAALNGNASEQHGLGPSAVEIENDGLKPLHVLVGSMVYIQQGDQLIVMDATAACDALALARQHGEREGICLNCGGSGYSEVCEVCSGTGHARVPAAPATDVGEGK